MAIFKKTSKGKQYLILQVTHCTKKDEKIWLDSLKGKNYFNHWTSQSASDFELCERKEDLNGRLLITKIKVDMYYVTSTSPTRKLDKIDIMSNKNDNIIYRKEIISMLDSMNLTDCFRDIFPNIRRYTWHSRGKSSRLDYWFISEHLLNELENYKIIPGLLTFRSLM